MAWACHVCLVVTLYSAIWLETISRGGQIFDCKIRAEVAKYLVTNWAPFSVRRYVEMLYGTTWYPEKLFATCLFVVFAVGIAHVRLEQRSVTTMMCWSTIVVCGCRPKMSMAKTPTVSIVRTPIVDVFDYSACYLRRRFCKRLQLRMRHGPYGASKICIIKAYICLCSWRPAIAR